MANIIRKESELLEEIRFLIASAKEKVAVAINSQMTILYWNIGKRIREEIIRADRAEYGQNIVESLANHLTAEYGKGFSRYTLSRMIKFYDLFTDKQIVVTLSQQLTWSHIIAILPLEIKEKSEFYTYMAIESKWSVRELRSNIHRMTYERTVATQKGQPLPLVTPKNEPFLVSADNLLKDPYILDFLDLPDNHYENDLEEAILKEIEKFILELGTGFTFVARQKRITVDADHFYLDLLFYNRKLRRSLAIELKTGKFKPEYKGQMELYLGYLKEYETYEGELPPIGIILCTEKSAHQVELLNMNQSGIHVAEYWTDLPPKEVFEKKIQEIVLKSRELVEKIENQE